MKNIKILRLKEGNLNEFKKLVELFNDVFEEPNTVASAKQLKKLLVKPDFCAFIVLKDGEIIGGLTAYELEQYYTDKSELYLYDIAVIKEYQNQGIGKLLLRSLKEYALAHNIKSIFVDADAEDEQAVKFYKYTIGESTKVDHFNLEIRSQE